MPYIIGHGSFEGQKFIPPPIVQSFAHAPSAHTSLAEAQTEAQRLAQAFPDTPFVIFQALESVCCASSPRLETHDLREPRCAYKGCTEPVTHQSKTSPPSPLFACLRHIMAWSDLAWTPLP